MARTQTRLECPPEFQQHLTDIFGMNAYGDPLFRFIWGQTETEVMLNPRGFYEERLLGHGQPCWILQQWFEASTYGPPEIFYYLNTDLDTGSPVTAYPEFGKYRDLVSFLEKRYDPSTGALALHTIELEWELIDRAIPLLVKSLELSEALKESIRSEIELAQETAKVALIADMLHDRLPAFYGPVSYAGQQMKTALIDRKMAQIEQEWRHRNLRRPPARGFFQKPLK